MSHPHISIVTPCYNADTYIAEMLESIASQTYEHFEHIIMDGGSTDQTLSIIDSFENRHDPRVVSESDAGMYDAIEKGFELATGDIFAWLNADDRYFPWALALVAEHLAEDGVDWITGHPTLLDADGRLHVGAVRPRFHRAWIRRGWYHGRGLGFIQQESTFWTADLWNAAGGFPDRIRLAGDFYLWRQFASEADLHTVDSILATWRKHDEQLSNDTDAYYAEIDTRDDLMPRLLGSLRAHEAYSILSCLLGD